MAAGDDEVVVARRLIAQRCLYGVDRNPMAVDLAKVSLWLATLAKEHPLTFVDHALRHGDSLVGLTQRRIETFHWEDGAEPLQQGIETIELRKCMARVAELRRLIRESDETVSDWELLGESHFFDLNWRSLTDYDEDYAALVVACEMIDGAVEGRCEECGTELLERLDFSQLASATSLEEPHETEEDEGEEEEPWEYRRMGRSRL